MIQNEQGAKQEQHAEYAHDDVLDQATTSLFLRRELPQLYLPPSSGDRFLGLVKCDVAAIGGGHYGGGFVCNDRRRINFGARIVGGRRQEVV